MIYIDNTPLVNYKNVKIEEELGGSILLTLSTFNSNNPAYHLLNEEAIITIGNEQFIVKQVTEKRYTKDIVAVSSFFGLQGIFKREQIYGGTHMMSEFLEWTFEDTGWTWELIHEEDPYIFIPNYGNDNVIKLVETFCEYADLEYKVLENNHVVFKENIGRDVGAQYRYGYNVRTLQKNVDTTKLATRIIGYGANGMNVTYTSPNAEKYGIIYAEPLHDEKFLDPDLMVERLKQELQDVPEISIEVDTIEMLERELGEKVWLIYEPLEIEVQSRILKITRTVKGSQLKVTSVVVGNSLPKGNVDLLVEQSVQIDKNRRQSMSYFEQTNEKIRLAVEAFNYGIEEARAEFQITADEIRAEVDRKEKDLDGKITETNSKIIQTSESIIATIDKEIKEVNGDIEKLSVELSATTEAITQSMNREFKKQNQLIEQQHSSLVQTLEGFETTVNKQLYDMEGKISENNSSVEQTAEQLRVEVRREMRVMENKVDRAVADFEITADSITSTVTSVENTVENMEDKVITHSSEIRQLDREINMKVSSDNIISEINISPERIKIKADRFEVDGISELNDDVYLGGSVGGARNASLYFGGSTASAIALNATNGGTVLDVWTPAGFTRFQHSAHFKDRVAFDDVVDFSRASVIGLDKAIQIAKPHQEGTKVWFDGDYMYARTPSGTTLKFRAE